MFPILNRKSAGFPMERSNQRLRLTKKNQPNRKSSGVTVTARNGPSASHSFRFDPISYLCVEIDDQLLNGASDQLKFIIRVDHNAIAWLFIWEIFAFCICTSFSFRKTLRSEMNIHIIHSYTMSTWSWNINIFKFYKLHIREVFNL